MPFSLCLAMDVLSFNGRVDYLLPKILLLTIWCFKKVCPPLVYRFHTIPIKTPSFFIHCRIGFTLSRVYTIYAHWF